jgi:hypothetical protein
MSEMNTAGLSPRAAQNYGRSIGWSVSTSNASPDCSFKAVVSTEGANQKIAVLGIF